MSQTDSNHRQNAQRLVDASRRIVFFNKTGPPNQSYLQHYQKEINDRISVYTGTTGNYIKDITCRQATKGGKAAAVFVSHQSGSGRFPGFASCSSLSS